MLNCYPLWKYLMVALVVFFCAIYALPNLYGEDPIIQVMEQPFTDPIRKPVLDTIKEVLEEKHLHYKSSLWEEGSVVVRFSDTETQILARDVINKVLNKNVSVALNIAPSTPGWLQAIGASPMKLGLDLRGGVHFLMAVDTDAAVDKRVSEEEESFRQDLRKQRLRSREIRGIKGHGIEVFFESSDQANRALDILKPRHTDMSFLVKEKESRCSLIARFKKEHLQHIRNYAVEQNVHVLRNRVNELGVADSLVQRQKSDHIVVELPGLQNMALAKEVLGTTATLEFREVSTGLQTSAAIAGKVPSGYEVKFDREKRPVVLKKRVVLEGSNIINANPGIDEYTRPQVEVTLDSEGGSKMSIFSRRNIGKLIATVFSEYRDSGSRTPEGKIIFTKHEEVINQARIQSILGRNFRITGVDSAEARRLALLLRAGALIAPVSVVEEKIIGPSMGRENIVLGVKACTWGLAAVMIFMLLYYRSLGLIASTALLANLIMMTGVLSLIPGVTITLSGIAGIVLTIGMAIDANVLIFERIREEISYGRNSQQSIHLGYISASRAIIDSNITTLITALILFTIGTSTVRGFAVTLSIGILTSMFTAIVGTRCIINLVYGGKDDTYRRSAWR